MALKQCSVDAAHQYPDHLSACPYCAQAVMRGHNGSIAAASASATLSQSTQSSVSSTSTSRNVSTASAPINPTPVAAVPTVAAAGHSPLSSSSSSIKVSIRSIGHTNPQPYDMIVASVECPPQSKVLSYQWQRSGSLIAGATSDNYMVRKEDLGKRLSVSATVTVPGSTSPLTVGSTYGVWPSRSKVKFVVIAVLCVALGVGLWLARPVLFPAHPAPTATPSASTAPTTTPTPMTDSSAIQPGVCLSLSAFTVDTVSQLDDLAGAIVPCDSVASQVRIIGVADYDQTKSNPDACDTSDWTNGCWWKNFSVANSQVSKSVSFETIPSTGQCFFGYLNTAYPTSGSSDGQGWWHLLSDSCGTVPAWATSASATQNIAQALGVDQSQLQLTEFTITVLSTSGWPSCSSGELSWGVYYSKGQQTYMCLATKKVQT